MDLSILDVALHGTSGNLVQELFELSFRTFTDGLDPAIRNVAHPAPQTLFYGCCLRGEAETNTLNPARPVNVELLFDLGYLFQVVGAGGFEPPTSASRTQRSKPS